MSVNCEESESGHFLNEEKDEFAQFVNASIHPPNELSIPRCYLDQVNNTGFKTPERSQSGSPYKKSKSLGSQNSLQKSLLSPNSLSPSLRPRLRREQAQDIVDDEDTRYNMNADPWPYKPVRPIHQRSAPGTPLNRRSYASRSSSRGDSADESGYLRVPLTRARGVSLPDSMEDDITTNNSYLLRQFNIKGRRVINLGDCYQRSGSVTSYGSGG